MKYPPLSNFINGRFHDFHGNRADVISPIDGGKLSSVPLCGGEEVDAAVREAMSETGATSARDMGKVMQAALKKLAGKTVDGKAVSARVRELLG